MRYLIFFACKGETKFREQSRLQAWLGRTSSGGVGFATTGTKRRAETEREARKGDKKSAKIIGGGVFSAY